MTQRAALQAFARRLVLLAAITAASLIAPAARAVAPHGTVGSQGSRGVVLPRIGGTLTYTGNLGPVSGRNPLCVCVYADASLALGLGCIIRSTNPAPYLITFSSVQTYFLIAFLDLDGDEGPDPGEPYEIYRDRASPPADPVAAGPTQTGVDFTFGDENLPAPSPSLTPTPTPTDTQAPTPTSTPEDTATPTVTSTATPSVVPTESPTPTPTATSTVAPPSCIGDCDGSGDVVINELIVMVNVALGTAEVSACAAGDRDHNGSIDITEITTAVNNANGSCPA